jgi:hypothetical protein
MEKTNSFIPNFSNAFNQGVRPSAEAVTGEVRELTNADKLDWIMSKLKTIENKLDKLKRK